MGQRAAPVRSSACHCKCVRVADTGWVSVLGLRLFCRAHRSIGGATACFPPTHDTAASCCSLCFVAVEWCARDCTHLRKARAASGKMPAFCTQSVIMNQRSIERFFQPWGCSTGPASSCVVKSSVCAICTICTACAWPCPAHGASVLHMAMPRLVAGCFVAWVRLLA